MFRLPLLVALALAIAFGGGIFATLKMLDATSGAGATRVGAWEAFPEIGTGAADPYARAHRSISGTLLYGTAEGLVFTATTDDAGNRLDSHCDYRIFGQMPHARLWTLHATDVQGRALRSAEGRPDALVSTGVLRMPPHGTVIDVSQQPQPYNWLALPPATGFRLVLTLLDTPAGTSADLAGTDMPRIEKAGCRNV